jgi:hypothetical protein
MTEDEARSIAKVAAKEALSEMLITLGVDPDEPTEMQKDMAFVRSLRESSEAVKRQGLLTAIGILVAGVLGLIWLAVKGG